MDRKRIPVIVGVSGGIAAYKACTVVRQLSEAGHLVRVIPTESALRFVGAATFEALSGQPVHTGVFEDVPEVPHVQLGQQADLVVVAPATADLLARAVARPGRRSADRDPAHGAMSGAVRTGDAHRDVVAPGHRRQRGHAAPPWCGGAGTRVRAAHRHRQRRGPAARGRGDHHPGRAAAGTPRRASLRPGRLQAAGDRRRHPRTDRPGALHRQPQLRQAGLRGGAGRRPARCRGHADRRAHRRTDRSGRRRRGARQLGGAARRRGVQARARRRTCW